MTRYLSKFIPRYASLTAQPVHFISRTMTVTEKRYSQTEKDALSVHWAKNMFSIYLLGAPKFKIITAHKPLLRLFNKAAMRLPPRTEKWVDFELIYEPERMMPTHSTSYQDTRYQRKGRML